MPGSTWKPPLIFGGACLVVLVLFLAREVPEDRIQPTPAPLVRVIPAEVAPYRFSVAANGSVSPRTESDLIPQVSGVIVKMSPALAVGGFFEPGDVLAQIDSADYRVERETARAEVARARSSRQRAAKELARQQRLAEGSVASEARIDDAENADRIAEASLREAQARLERAERDLDRTEIRAPYRGRVRSEQVDVGQFVSRGTAIARIYAIDYAEIRLPIPDRELAYLDVPLMREIRAGEETEGGTGSRVELSAEFAGRMHKWEGQLVRTGAELDPRSRMVNLVARVRDPLGLETPRSAPLAVGLFVDAKIDGQSVDRAFVLPRDALRNDELVFIVDDEGRIRFRQVEVLRVERHEVVVASGLEAGERVCISPLDAAIDGMQVRVVDAQLPTQVADPESESPPTTAAAAPATPAETIP